MLVLNILIHVKDARVDNARIESFYSLLKREYINFQIFKPIYEADAGIDQYIRWYNQDRISLVGFFLSYPIVTSAHASQR